MHTQVRNSDSRQNGVPVIYRSNDNRTTVPEHPSATRNPDGKNSGNGECAISKTTPKASRANAWNDTESYRARDCFLTSD